ncbi:MAG: amino acid adenylation domain-containing protein [Blastocatellia bacterium]
MSTDDLSDRWSSLSPAKRLLLEKRLRREMVVAPARPPIVRREGQGPTPLSYAQQRLWFIQQADPETSVYNIARAIRLTGPLSPSTITQCLTETTRRHCILRTVFDATLGEPVQIISPCNPISMPVVDLSELPPIEQQRQVRRLASLEARQPFDLAAGPVIRARLLRLRQQECVLLFTMHHIASDARSAEILIGEMQSLYRTYSNGETTPLPELEIQYADFAEWQQKWLQSESLDQQLSYWKKQLANCPPVLELQTDFPRPAIKSFRGASRSLVLSDEVGERLKELGQHEKATLFMTLLAGFKALLYRYTQQEDICVGTVTSNRNYPETENLIGFFVDTLVLRTQLEGNLTFRSLLARVRETSVEAYAHRDVPFEKLVQAVQPVRNLSHTPFFQIALIFQSITGTAAQVRELRMESLGTERGTAKYDLTLILVERNNRISATLEYSTDLFEATTITRMLSHLRSLLETVIKAPDRRVSSISVLSVPEQHSILYEWNDSAADYPSHLCAHDLFEGHARLRPDTIALVFKEEHLTYGELDSKANDLAGRLLTLGAGPNCNVGVCLEQSPLVALSILAIFKSGGAFVPIEPRYPAERLAFMFGDSHLNLVLTEQKLMEKIPNQGFRRFCLDADWKASYARGSQPPVVGSAPDDVAYIIYTSGSTGKPKGTLVNHRGLCNLPFAQDRAFGPGVKDRVLQFASLSFDASIFEIVMALCHGATLCFAPRESLLPGPDFTRLLKEQSITNITLPPSTLAALDEEKLPSLQTLIVAGEDVSADLVSRWSKGRSFFNAYGPTEATVWSTVARSENPDRKPEIGRPIENTKVYVLDSNLSPVPVGVVGELHIAGVGLAYGYLNCSDLTADKFIPNPFSRKPGSRLYKTGDLARYRSDGNVDFLGRLDNQVKVRGFRIELREIEEALRQHERVKDAVALVADDESGDKRIVAYAVLDEDHESAPAMLRDFLRIRLPEYMIPSIFIPLSVLPQTPNGKIDRRALPLPAGNTGLAYLAPQTRFEQVIAQVWQEILKVEKVGLNDNFFDLGGHSLLAVRVHKKLQEVLNMSISIVDLFQYPSVSALARHLEQDAGDSLSSPQSEKRDESLEAGKKRFQRLRQTLRNV